MTPSSTRSALAALDLTRHTELAADQVLRDLALALHRSGDHDEAVRFLREACSEGVHFENALHADPLLESLRDHAGFQEFVRPKG